MEFKRLPLVSLFMILFAVSYGQAIISNGDFEQWESEELYVEFPPFESITNLFAVFENIPPNVTQVAGCDGGKAARLETILLGEDTVAGLLTIGDFTPLVPGLPFTGEPDSMRLCVRYNIEPGDTAMIFVVFFAGGQLAAQVQPNPISGSQASWTSWTVDLPPFIQTPDSFALAITSSWFDDTPPILGSWLEIDSLYMLGSTDQFPNFNFEICDTTTFEDPVDWFSPNRFLEAFDAPSSTSRSTDSYSGNFAARIETVTINLGGGEDTLAFLTNGQDVSDDGALGGQAYTGMSIPTNISGFYKYEPVGNDTAIAYVLFAKHDASGDSLIEIGEFATLLPPSAAYSYFDIPLDLTEMPDSFQLTFGASDFTGELSQSTAGVGSVLWVDSLHFNGLNSVDRELAEAMKLTVFPNPAQNFVEIRFEPLVGQAYVVELSGVNGQLLLREDVVDNLSGSLVQRRFDLNRYMPGLYFLSLKNENGDLLATKKLVIVK